MKHSILAFYMVAVVFAVSTQLSAAGASGATGAPPSVKQSEVIRFLPEKLPEDKKWLEVYGVVPLDLKRLDVKEYNSMVWQFAQYLDWILKPGFVPSKDFITKNLILIPASSIKDHSEDVAYLRYSIGEKDYLVTQTEVGDKGRILLFVKNDSDEVLLKEVPEDSPRLEPIEQIEWPESECFIFSKEAYGRIMERAWGGPKADKWFETFKNKPPEPKIPFKEVAEALEKLPPERRMKLYQNYRGAMSRRSAAQDIIKEASKSKYTDENRLKDDAEYDKRVREAIKVVGKDNGLVSMSAHGYVELRKQWDERYERLSAARRIGMEAEFHKYGDLVIGVARKMTENDEQE